MKSAHDISDTDFLQAPISLDSIDSTEFERLIFYLLDEIGFTNIVWRKGGEGNTATDGGRDLEASYWRLEPFGTIDEKYWIEVKYRDKQLDTSTVQKVVNNANGKPGLERLIIVTNSTVSNSCIDWTTEFQKKNTNIKILVWQGHDIELLLRKTPKTLSQFFPTSLNRSGRFKVIKSRFLNFHHLPSEADLLDLWNSRQYLVEKEEHLLILSAVLGEERSNGLDKRKWGMVIDNNSLMHVVALGLDKLFDLIDKIQDERSEGTLVRSLSYLLQCLLIRSSVDDVFNVLTKPEIFVPGSIGIRADFAKLRLESTVDCMLEDLVVRCSHFCAKVSYDRDEILDNRPPYFSRFVKSGETKDNEDRVFISMNGSKGKCEIGLVAESSYCPFLEPARYDISKRSGLINALKFMKNVLEARIRLHLIPTKKRAEA